MILTLNDSMSKYIASGILKYPMGAIDLFSINSPKRQITNKFAHAIEATFQMPLMEDLIEILLTKMTILCKTLRK